MPKVSVVIPAHNHGSYIAEAIHSVLDQTFRDYEIIVVDDGSTDNTASVLEEFDSQIRHVRRQHARGPGAAKNCGIRLARAELVATLDADDLWFPWKLEMQVRFMESHPEVALCYANIYNFDTISRQAWPLSGFELSRPHSGYVFGKLLCNNFIPSQSVMLRKACLEQVGLFDESLMIGEDRELWLRIAAHYPVGYVDVPVGGRRLHHTNLTHDECLKLSNNLRIMESAVLRYGDRLTQGELQQVAFTMGARRLALIREHILREDLKSARSQCREAWRGGLRSLPLALYWLLASLPVSVSRTMRDAKRGLRKRLSRQPASGLTIDEIRSSVEANLSRMNPTQAS